MDQLADEIRKLEQSTDWKKHGQKSASINRHNKTFYTTLHDRIQKLIAKRPEVLAAAIEELHDEAKKGIRQVYSLEHLIKRVARRKLSPKKRGRPREDGLRQRVNELKAKHSWKKAKPILDKEFGEHSLSAYRNYTRRA